MLERARAATAQANVRYVEAFGAETGLPDGRADLVTSFQSFHWMEPQPVLAEAARILRDGGVFAACDYDVPPFVEPEVDAAFSALLKARREARERLGIPAGAASWPKGPASRGDPRERTLSVHARAASPTDGGRLDAGGVAGLAESIGALRHHPPEQLRLRETADRVLGDRTWPQLLCYRIRIGIK